MTMEKRERMKRVEREWNGLKAVATGRKDSPARSLPISFLVGEKQRKAMLRVLALVLSGILCCSPPAEAKTHRSRTQVMLFLREQGYSRVPRGYQVDHIIPLCAGGPDIPDNMQLLTIREHREKTKQDIMWCREIRKQKGKR